MPAFDPQTVHSAMEAAGGNAANASKALGVSESDLYNYLHDVPFLRRRWRRSKEDLKEVDQEGAALYKPHNPIPTSDVHGLELAANGLKRGFEALGLKGEVLGAALAIQQFARKSVKELMGYMAGSIVKQFADIETEIEAISKRLAGFEKKGDEWVPAARPLTIEEEQMLREDRQGLMDLRIKSYDRAVKAQVALALANAKANGMQKGAGGRPSTPGFGPLEKRPKKGSPPPTTIEMPPDVPAE